MNINYNFLIIGDEKVGKSTFLNRMKYGSFIDEYIATINQSISELKFNTNKGPVTMSFIELNKQVSIVEVPKLFYPIDGVIILFDNTADINTILESVKMFHNYFNKYTNNIIVCGNKSDLVKHNTQWYYILRELVIDRLSCKYFDVSSKSNYNFDKPYLWLLKGLMGNNLEFINY